MRVFKFGGASVKDADGVINLAKILESNEGNLVVVVSAMGKTTNLLENLVKEYFNTENSKWEIFDQFKKYHLNIIDDLNKNTQSLSVNIDTLFNSLEKKLQEQPSDDFNFEYDQIVCYGELTSTTIISCYLNAIGITNQWIDIRNCLRTDDKFRAANVDWNLTEKQVKETFIFNGHNLYLTQGFIGSTATDISTTLGREGSDYTGAIIGNILDATEVAIWKDVPGVLNADPKLMSDAKKIDVLSYREAVEMSYSGAKVIHPKTMKPLHNKDIPLLVKSFYHPDEAGTIIKRVDHKLNLIPVYIFKEKQVLITLSPRDFSFIDENDISHVIEILKTNRLTVNVMQQSAIDFSLVVDFPVTGLENVIDALHKKYETKYNTNLKLITIRHYTDEAVDYYKKSGKVYLEQKSRLTTRLVVK